MEEPQKEKGKPRAVRVYADTSVFGGVFDPEFSVSSGKFFQQVKEGRFRLVVSTLVDNELARAPQPVRALLNSVRDFAAHETTAP